MGKPAAVPASGIKRFSQAREEQKAGVFARPINPKAIEEAVLKLEK